MHGAWSAEEAVAYFIPAAVVALLCDGLLLIYIRSPKRFEAGAAITIPILACAAAILHALLEGHLLGLLNPLDNPPGAITPYTRFLGLHVPHLFVLASVVLLALAPSIRKWYLGRQRAAEAARLRRQTEILEQRASARAGPGRDTDRHRRETTAHRRETATLRRDTGRMEQETAARGQRSTATGRHAKPGRNATTHRLRKDGSA